MGKSDEELTDKEIHRRLDALARAIAISIDNGREYLNSLPDFEDGRSERAKDLSRFMKRFGGQ